MEKGLWLNSRGREFEATRERTELFKYIGELACYDHVAVNGIPTFRVFRHEWDYPAAEQYCIEHEYPQSIFQRHAGEAVRREYIRSRAEEYETNAPYFHEELEGDEDYLIVGGL